MPVILDIWEAEIRRIEVWDQPSRKMRPYLKITQHTKKGSSDRSTCLANVRPWVQTPVNTHTHTHTHTPSLSSNFSSMMTVGSVKWVAVAVFS
jgi:hypothetical protein